MYELVNERPEPNRPYPMVARDRLIVAPGANGAAVITVRQTVAGFPPNHFPWETSNPPARIAVANHHLPALIAALEAIRDGE